jgi:hypothetical protein
MKISDRFTDYGLIGGFFWLLQCSLFAIVFLPMAWDDSLPPICKDLAAALSASSNPVLAGLLGALGLIVIFTTGLLLDLLGSSLVRGTEAYIFVKHLQRNSTWLGRLMQENGDYVQDDWAQLSGAPMSWSRENILIGFKGLMFWNSRYRREFASKSFGLRKPYTRIQSFLLIYVLIAAGVEKLELLSAQINLWNTGRAIAAGAALGALVGAVLATTTTHSLIFFFAEVVLLVLSTAISYNAYARVCSTLFALAYVVSSRTPALTPR